MSIPISQEISDIKGEFEGGVSLSVDFYAILRRAQNNVLDNVNPETLKRRVAIYGGIIGGIQIYYCPADLKVPCDIYENNGRFGNSQVSSGVFHYVPSKEFYSKQEYDKYTIEYINGVRFLVIRHSKTEQSTTIEEMEAVAGITSDQTLSLNEHDFIYGSASLQRSFSAESGTAFTVDASTDFLTSSAHGLLNGERVMVFSSTTLPTGISARTVYFVVNKTADTFQLSLTSGGTAIDLTDTGTGTHKWHVATQNEVSKTITAIDISDYLNGAVLFPTVFTNAFNINRVEFVLETDTENYYTLTSTADSIGDNFIDGQNIIRFGMAGVTTTGTPTNTNITKWRLRVVLKDGATAQIVVLDKLTIQKSAHYLLEYYSNRMFIDGTTGAWKDTPVAGDSINLDRDARGIIHYEAVILIGQNSTYISLSAQDLQNFSDQLRRKYTSYNEDHPSSAEPISYNQERPQSYDAGGGMNFGSEQLNIEVQPYP
jgi:hypothetical protein